MNDLGVYTQKECLKKKKWNKNFLRHIKCERIHHQKPALQEILKEILQGVRK